MRLQASIIISCLGLLAPIAGFAQTDSSEKDRARLEELFVWKASETLRLPPDQEQKFTKLVHDLNDRKKHANAKMEKAIAQLSSAKAKAESEKALANYRGVLKEYQALQFTELDQMKSLLGTEKLVRYLVVKSELSEQLKALLSGPRSQDKAPPASAPKIIEER